ncbi:v-type proton atpase catalytic subunit a [Holotrichia oblita]|nr:v-type proton atpase catalytic subunit a [Holotrichia oblita]
MHMLQEEAELNEIVSLVGYDALSEKDQLKLESAKSIREDYLQQNAFHEMDSYTSIEKQYKLLELVLNFNDEANKALNEGVYLKKILALSVRDQIARAKYTSEDNLSQLKNINEQIVRDVAALIKEEVDTDA